MENKNKKLGPDGSGEASGPSESRRGKKKKKMQTVKLSKRCFDLYFRCCCFFFSFCSVALPESDCWTDYRPPPTRPRSPSLVKLGNFLLCGSVLQATRDAFSSPPVCLSGKVIHLAVKRHIQLRSPHRKTKMTFCRLQRASSEKSEAAPSSLWRRLCVCE